MTPNITVPLLLKLATMNIGKLTFGELATEQSKLVNQVYQFPTIAHIVTKILPGGQ